MNKESLNIVKNEIMNLLDRLAIDDRDRAELFINLYHFLDENKYSNNIKTLRQRDDMEKKQISIDEYVKSLKPKGDKNE